MQLIGDGVTMIDALHQKTYTREEVIKKMGVPPEQIPDFLALVGDTSDNIPGMRGVGDKTAATLLAQYGIARDADRGQPGDPADPVKQPFGDPEQLARVKMSRQLVELKRDVPLPIPLEDLVVSEWDLPGLMQLFTELEFRLLVDKVKMKMPPSDDATVVPAPEATPLAQRRARAPIRTIVVRREAIAELAAAARAAGRMALTIELSTRAASTARRWSRSSSRCPARRRRTSRSGIATSARRRRRRPRTSRRSTRCSRMRRSRRSPTTRSRSCARSPISASRSRASPRTRCSPRSCSIRRPRPSRARRSSQRLGGVMVPARDDDRRQGQARARAGRGRARGAVGGRDHLRAPADRRAAAAAAHAPRTSTRSTATSSCRSRCCSPTSSAPASTSTSAHFKALSAEVDTRVAALERQIFDARGRGVQHRLAEAARGDPVREARPRRPRASAARRPACRPTRIRWSSSTTRSSSRSSSTARSPSSRAPTSTRCRR